MVKTRVHLLAKDLGIEPKDLIAHFEKIGIRGKKAQSSLEDNEVARIRAALGTPAKPQVTVREENVVAEGVITAGDQTLGEIQALEKIVERRVRATVIRRRTSRVEVIPQTAPTQIRSDSVVMARQEPEQIARNRNRIYINGVLGHADFHPLLAAIDDAASELGYEDLVLDFSECTAAFAGPMLAVCAQVVDLRARGVRTELVLPVREKLATLFKNTNWAYFLDPARQDQSRFKGHTQVPLTQFITAPEQNGAVNTIVDAVLSSMTDFTRTDFAAIEWSLNEITDNVLTHARSVMGGLVQLTTFERKRRRVEFAVCDAGIGIPMSLRETHPEITSDVEALERAIREGITRDTEVGQGNGLFGSFQICRISGGYFQIHSGDALLNYNDQGGLHIRRQQIPYAGTLVVACIDCSKPGVLRDALKFGTSSDVPTDYIETRYESGDNNKILFSMKEEAASFGSRLAAVPVRTKLKNLALMCEDQRISIDFADIPLISSSFADEVFGKLFVELGPLHFIQKFEFLQVADTVRSLIDRAIAQRSVTRH